MSITQTIELFEGSRACTEDRLGNRSGVRRFLTPTTPDLAKKQTGIPKVGDSFDFDGISLPVLSVSSEPTKRPNVSLVVVQYSNTNSGQIERVDDTDSNFQSYNISVTESIAIVPGFRPRLIREFSTGAETIRRVWDREDLQVRRQKTLVVARVNVETFGLAQLRAIQKQQGKVHFFGGEYYAFIGADSSLERATGDSRRTQITYTWFTESPIPALGSENPPPEATVYPNFVLESLFGYVVHPQQDLIGSQPPVVRQVSLYDETDYGGYSTLPGNPIG